MIDFDSNNKFIKFIDFKDKHQNLYSSYKFEKITHEDAIEVYLTIKELQVYAECKTIREIQNIKTKCEEILNILEKYKQN